MTGIIGIIIGLLISEFMNIYLTVKEEKKMALFKKKSLEEVKSEKFASSSVSGVEVRPPMPLRNYVDRELKSEEPVASVSPTQKRLLELVKSINSVYGGYTSPGDVAGRSQAELNAEVLVLLLGIFDNLSQVNDSLRDLVSIAKEE